MSVNSMKAKAHVTRSVQTPLGHSPVFASQDIHQQGTSALVRMLKYSMLSLIVDRGIVCMVCIYV